jgi:hypothetical protein
MARHVVVYDVGDVVGHYNSGLHKIVTKEVIGDPLIHVRNVESGRLYYEESHKIYLIKDVNNIIKGRTLRVYMTQKEIVDWSNKCYEMGNSRLNKKATTISQVFEMLGCENNRWYVITTDYSILSTRLKLLLKTVMHKEIVVAMKRTTNKITTIVGESQPKGDVQYGSCIK